MTRKVLITFALIVFSVTIASAQAVGTYKATRASTVKERIERPHKPLFLGVNAGINGTVGTIQSLDFTLGADIAFSKTETFACGFFAGYETVTKANYGLLFVHGNYVKGSAFFWGLGYSLIFDYEKELDYEGISFNRDYERYRLLLRLGFQKRSPLYYNITLSAGSLERKDYYRYETRYLDDEGFFGAAVTVGYRFNTKLKTN